MVGLTPEQIDVLARSIALHASGLTGASGHLGEFAGVTSTDDIARSIKQMLSDPDTKFLVNASEGKPNSGSVYLFNEKSQSFLVFNPSQLRDSGDNLAGTFYREPAQRADGQAYSKQSGRDYTPTQASGKFQAEIVRHQNAIADDMGIDRRVFRASAQSVPTGITASAEWSERIANHVPEINGGYHKAVNREAAAVLADDATMGFWKDENGRQQVFLNQDRKAVVNVVDNVVTDIDVFSNTQNAKLGFGRQLQEAVDMFPNAHKGSVPDVFDGGKKGLTEALAHVRAGGLLADFKNAARQTGEFLGRATKILGAVGVAYTGYEAAGLALKSHQMADFGLMPKSALLGYDAMLGGFIAQATLDPTMVGGEFAIQEAYDLWAKEYNISDAVKTELQPGLLINDIKDLIVSAHETMQNLASGMIEQGAPLALAVMENVGKKDFMEMSKEDQVRLVMERFKDELAQPDGLHRLVSQNTQYLAPDDIGAINKIFNFSIPVPTLPNDGLKTPGGGNWFDKLPSLPALPSLPSFKDLLPDIIIPRFEVPKLFKLGDATEGQRDLPALQDALYASLPTHPDDMAGLDDTMRNMAEIKVNIGALEGKYQQAVDGRDMLSASILQNHIEDNKALFNSEAALIMDEIGLDAMNDMVAKVEDAACTRDGAGEAFAHSIYGQQQSVQSAQTFRI